MAPEVVGERSHPNERIVEKSIRMPDLDVQSGFAIGYPALHAPLDSTGEQVVRG